MCDKALSKQEKNGFMFVPTVTFTHKVGQTLRASLLIGMPVWQSIRVLSYPMNISHISRDKNQAWTYQDLRCKCDQVRGTLQNCSCWRATGRARCLAHTLPLTVGLLSCQRMQCMRHRHNTVHEQCHTQWCSNCSHRLRLGRVWERLSEHVSVYALEF